MSVFTSPCRLRSDLLHLHPPPRVADYLPADPRTRPRRGAGLGPGWRCSPPSWRSCWGWSWHWLTEKNPARTGEEHVRKSSFREDTPEPIHNWRTDVFRAARGVKSELCAREAASLLLQDAREEPRARCVVCKCRPEQQGSAMPFVLSHFNNRHSSDRCLCDFVPASRVQNRPITSWRSSRKCHLDRSSAAFQRTRRRRRNGTAAATTPRNTVFQQTSRPLPSTRGGLALPCASTLAGELGRAGQSFLTHLHDVEPERLGLCRGDGGSTTRRGFRAE